jgi:putative autoinducer-2 (AI-2) aldolase
MADLEGNIDSKDFGLGTPQVTAGSPVKGAGQLDFGMRHRLSRIFKDDGRTVMLAFDHGYFQGPTSGLERVDLNIVPLAPQADALMATRGVLRSVVPASLDTALVVRVFIGGEQETQSVHNLTQQIDAGLRLGIPVLGVTAVGKELTRDSRYLGLATRIIAELGAQMVKTYYCPEGFEQVTAGCPVPVIMAGGKKLPSLEALTMAHRAISEGAAGVDMGRNIFQRKAPAAMIQAVRSVVHGGATAEEAHAEYRELSGGAED